MASTTYPTTYHALLTTRQNEIFQKDFDAFDTDKSGALNDDEIKALVAQQSGTPIDQISQEQLDSLMAEFDKNQDGKIQFEEYRRVICSSAEVFVTPQGGGRPKDVQELLENCFEHWKGTDKFTKLRKSDNDFFDQDANDFMYTEAEIIAMHTWVKREESSHDGKLIASEVKDIVELAIKGKDMKPETIQAFFEAADENGDHRYDEA